MSKENLTIIPYLEGFLQKLYNDGWKFPDFKNAKKVACVSDYVWGDRKNQRFNIHAYLYFDLLREHNHFALDLHTLKKREKLWNSKSIIDYKRLKKDSHKQRFLPDFLTLSDKIYGLLAVFCVDKNLKSIFFTDDYSKSISSDLLSYGYGKWTSPVFRKLCESLLIQSFFTSKLLQPNQYYEWWSDRDPINDNGKDGKKKDVNLKLLQVFFELFHIKPSGVRYGIIKEVPYTTDIMNIADLAVGATAKYLNESADIKHYTSDIVKWLLNEENKNLKKIVIQVQQDNNDIHISRIRLKREE